MFTRTLVSVDPRKRIVGESAPFVIQNKTDLLLKVTFGEFYRVSDHNWHCHCI